MKNTVCIIEDDRFLAQAFSERIEDLGFATEVFDDMASLLRRSRRKKAPFCVISDLHIPISSMKGKKTGSATAQPGLELLREARKLWPMARLILATGMPSLDAQKWCEENDVLYLIKPVDGMRLAGILGAGKRRAFVVHGRDEAARKKAVKALERAGVVAVCLLEQPNKGLTVIEKFETVAKDCDCAVVVWSADDRGGLLQKKGLTKASWEGRARQNVVFELGYFYGALRRLSGTVMIVEFGKTEIPSDLAGIIRVNGEQRLSKLSEEIKREIG